MLYLLYYVPNARKPIIYYFLFRELELQDVQNMEMPPDMRLKMLTCRDFKKYTNMLLVAVFGRDVLATHCLHGSKGSAKPRLDRDKVARVIGK